LEWRTTPRTNTDDEDHVVDRTYRYRRVEQQSAFLLQHRRHDAKISAGGTSEKGTTWS
jgi:hypothetical protein